MVRREKGKVEGKMKGKEKEVEIRCRRHHKRISVPESWLGTSEYLCPQCYGKLSAKEREAYEPVGGKGKRKSKVKAQGVPVEGKERACSVVKEREASKRTKEKCREYLTLREKSVEESGNAGKVLKRAGIVEASRGEREEAHRASSVEEGKGKKSTKLEKLKPPAMILCRRCGEVAPCFTMWFETSKYLCPSCYSELSQEEVAEIHKCCEEGGEVPERLLHAKKKEQRGRPRKEKDPLLGKWSDTLEGSKVVSQTWLAHQSEKGLLAAVKNGKVSRVRAKMELNRRKNRKRFQCCPEVEGAKFMW